MYQIMLKEESEIPIFLELVKSTRYIKREEPKIEGLKITCLPSRIRIYDCEKKEFKTLSWKIHYYRTHKRLPNSQ